MNKLKQAFGKKDDEPCTNAATGEEVQPERRRSSIMRQILNPGGDKYDEDIHGTTATATPTLLNPAHFTPSPDVKLRTDPEQERKASGGILSQLINPDGKKFDETRHGSTTVPVEDARRAGSLETDPAKDVQDKKTHGVARQIFNPGGEKYSEQSFGDTARTVPDEISGANPDAGSQGYAVPSSSSKEGSTMLWRDADK